MDIFARFYDETLRTAYQRDWVSCSPKALLWSEQWLASACNRMKLSLNSLMCPWMELGMLDCIWNLLALSSSVVALSASGKRWRGGVQTATCREVQWEGYVASTTTVKLSPCASRTDASLSRWMRFWGLAESRVRATDNDEQRWRLGAVVDDFVAAIVI